MTASLHDPYEARAARWGWLVIASAVLLTYWPLSSFHYTLTHGDTLNCWLPWRWYISSCLMDGHFPLWNPHQQFGYPMHADLQGPAWYIESLALGGTIGHGIHTLQALYLLYVMIGGWGMMRLVRTLHDDARIGTVIGTAYALGGFFTGHQQHFYAIISAAWLPWLFDAFLRLLRGPGWRSAARVALVQGLLLTGGNHTFTIISGYVLLALLLVHAIERWKKERWAGVRALVVWCGAAAIGAALIAVGVLHAWWEAGPELARGEGLAYDAAKVGPVTTRALISLFFPFATGTGMEHLGTDAPMANAYMGALMLPLAIAALFRRRSAVENVLLIAGLIAGFAAFGDGTPVHRWLWSNLPGMDLFRFPAYFRWYTWLAVLVLAAGSLRVWWNGTAERGSTRVLFVLTSLIAMALCAVAITRMEPDGEGFSLFERMRAMDLDRRVVLCAAVSLPVLFAAMVLLLRRRLSFPLLLVLLLLEMGWNTSLAQWNTAVADIRPRWLHDRLASLSEGPVIPEMVPTSTHDDNGQRLHYLSHNTQDFLGGFSRKGVNTFWLRNAMELEVEHTALWNAMARHPVVYLADSMVPWERYRAHPIAPESDGRLAVFHPGHSTQAFPASANDHAQVVDLQHDAFTVRCGTQRTALLVLQQSFFPGKNTRFSGTGWGVWIDGTERILLNVNVAAMAVEVPPGRHTVEFRYRQPAVPWLLAVSLVTFFGLLFTLVFTAPGAWVKGGAVALLAAVGWSLFAHGRGTAPRTEEAMNKLVHNLPGNASVVLNDDGASPMPTQGDMAGWRLRADDPRSAGRAAYILRAAVEHRTSGQAPGTSREVHWIDAALKADPAVRAMIVDRYDVVRATERYGSTDLQLAPRTHPAGWRTFVQGNEERWLTKDNPFGNGCTIPLDSLKAWRNGSIVVDLLANAPHQAEAVIVSERKRGGRTTDYRALPIGFDPTWGGAQPCYAVLPIDEVWRPGEDLKIYVWSHQGDSLSEQGFRVRVAPRTFHRW